MPQGTVNTASSLSGTLTTSSSNGIPSEDGTLALCFYPSPLNAKVLPAGHPDLAMRGGVGAPDAGHWAALGGGVILVRLQIVPWGWFLT